MKSIRIVVALVTIALIAWFVISLSMTLNPFPGFGPLGIEITLALVLLAAWLLFKRHTERKREAPVPVQSQRWKRYGIKLLILIPFIIGGITELGDAVGRRHAVFLEATKVLANSEQAQNILGRPVQIGWPIKLSIEESADAGYTNMTIPVSGSLHSAVLQATGTKIGGAWKLDEVDLDVRNAVSSKLTLR